MSVACVVVTRDRRALLAECLHAIAAQTMPVMRVFVVDNASSDGTASMLRRDHAAVEVITLGENAGSAGGYRAGIDAARRSGARWVWLLDDDSVARPDALERLLDAPWREAGLPEPVLLASAVEWTDGSPHPMNRPSLLRRDLDLVVRAAGVGLLPIRTSTFVSTLVAAEAVGRHGLPRAEYFLQADDMEFTARILRHEPGYAVAASVVEHRTASATDATADPRRFFFHLRNTLYMLRSPAWATPEKGWLAWSIVTTSARFVRGQPLRHVALRTVAAALRSGARGPRREDAAAPGR